MKTENLKPTALFGYFEEICGIPRPSKHEEKMTAYLKAFGESRGLQVKNLLKLFAVTLPMILLLLETAKLLAHIAKHALLRVLLVRLKWLVEPQKLIQNYVYAVENVLRHVLNMLFQGYNFCVKLKLKICKVISF